MRSASLVIASSRVLPLAVSTLPPESCRLQAARARVKKARFPSATEFVKESDQAASSVVLTA